MEKFYSYFEKDIRNYILDGFRYFGIKYKFTEKLDDDLINLFTLQTKYILPQTRTVEISNELRLKLTNKIKEFTAIHYLIYALKHGLNINSFQSNKLFNYRVHDKLIYDWNIFHLHLSLEDVIDEFSKRTKNLLFIYIKDNRALLLDILPHIPPHTVFAETQFLRIIDNNWKDVLHYASSDIIGISHSLNSTERSRFRKANINEGLLEINGKIIFSPGLGYAASGHSTDAVRKLIAFNRWIKSSIRYIEEHKLNYNEFKIIFANNGPEIINKTSGQTLLYFSRF